MSPCWRIGRLERNDPWGWQRLASLTVWDVQTKLSNFESMTWDEILIKAKTQHHSVSVETICKRAQERLEQLGYGDLEKLISLRLEGKVRVWGVMNGGVLTLLWYDPNHEICPSAKKHT